MGGFRWAGLRGEEGAGGLGGSGEGLGGRSWWEGGRGKRGGGGVGEGLGWEGPVGGAEPQPTAHAAIRAIPHRIIPQKYLESWLFYN